MGKESNKFWAIVELFGHTVLAGQVSKCDIGDFIQINIPQIGSIPEWTKMVNPKAVYAITPCSEQDAISRATELKSMPISKWDTNQLVKNHLKELEQKGQIKMIESSQGQEIEYDGNEKFEHHYDDDEDDLDAAF